MLEQDYQDFKNYLSKNIDTFKNKKKLKEILKEYNIYNEKDLNFYKTFDRMKSDLFIQYDKSKKIWFIFKQDEQENDPKKEIQKIVEEELKNYVLPVLCDVLKPYIKKIVQQSLNENLFF